MASLNKIHVTNSTGLTLNDRFTAIAKHRVHSRAKTQTNGGAQGVQSVNPNVASANRRLLLQLERRHKMLAAMKLKRRSLRAPAGAILKRGTIKALRVGANGKPIKANSLTKFATMNADLISNGRRRSRSLRRTGSNTNTPVVNRLGMRSGRGVGGAAERVAKRRISRLRTQIKQQRNSAGYVNPVNQRSRSRVRDAIDTFPTKTRGRSMSRGRSQSRGRSSSRARSQSRNRRPIQTQIVRRSISRNRYDVTKNQESLSVKERLGVRTNKVIKSSVRNNNVNGGRKIVRGLIQERPANAQHNSNRNNIGGRKFQTRRRSQSQSRVRKVQTQNLQQNPGVRNGRIGRRGRSRQRGFGNGNVKNVRNDKPQMQKPQPQRRGRSRSRQNDGRRKGKNPQQLPNKDDLDKELDQYMATTKTENDMGYLLRN